MWEGAKGGGVYDLGVGRVRKLLGNKKERNGRGGRVQFTVEEKTISRFPSRKTHLG